MDAEVFISKIPSDLNTGWSVQRNPSNEMSRTKDGSGPRGQERTAWFRCFLQSEWPIIHPYIKIKIRQEYHHLRAKSRQYRNALIRAIHILGIGIIFVKFTLKKSFKGICMSNVEPLDNYNIP
jgi:hypothetical protein